MLKKFRQYQFLFEELVRRDFKKKYKRTVLGMFWSVLSPLLMLLVMKLVFTQFFGRTMLHFTTYLFAGNLVFSYFREATNEGMGALIGNSGIIAKVNVPKYLFLLSKIITAFINFLVTLVIFFIFAALDGITFTPLFFAILYPVFFLTVFNIGMGLILSALYVFFRDTQYLYNVFTQLLMYLSAIFYSIDRFPAVYQKLFLLNPVYVYIASIRAIVIDGVLPDWQLLALGFCYAALVLLIGAVAYRRHNYRFLYYM
jgi:ABC-2 type transport system permease protein